MSDSASTYFYDPVAATLLIRSPEENWVFKRGCPVAIRCMVDGYSNETVRLTVVAPNRAIVFTGDLPMVDASGTSRRFAVLLDTSTFNRGRYQLRFELRRRDAVLTQVTRTVEVLAMQWPEPCELWGGFNPVERPGLRQHLGVDLWWVDPISSE